MGAVQLSRPVSSLWRPLADVGFEALEEAVVATEHPGAVGLRTSIPVLDQLAAQAFEPGRLVVVAGRSGGAKTALCAQLCVAFGAQVPVMLVTLEDDPRDMVKRSLAMLSRESVAEIRSGFPGGIVPASVSNAAAALGGLRIDVADEPGAPTVEALGYMVQAWRDQFPDEPHAVVVIDQLSHLRRSDPRDPVWDRLTRLQPPPPVTAPDWQFLEWQVAVLRQMAVRQNLTVVLAHQLNDSVTDEERPTERSIRGSRGIVQKADLVLCPWIPKTVPNTLAGPGDPKRVPNVGGVAELVNVKGRTVPYFEAPVSWVGSQQRFTDRDENTTVPWRPVPAPTAEQRAGAQAMIDLRAKFALAALERQAAAVSAVAPIQELDGGDDVTVGEFIDDECFDDPEF